MIYCLMASGTPLTEAMRNHLFSVAREMVAAGATKRSFKTETFEGAVYTKGEQAQVGQITGIYFTAVMESTNIDTKVKFIVPVGELEDLDKARWYELFPHWDDGPSMN